MIASVFCAACAHHSTRNMPATRALRRAPARATFQLSSDDDNNATLVGVLPSTYKLTEQRRQEAKDVEHHEEVRVPSATPQSFNSIDAARPTQLGKQERPGPVAD